MEPTPKHVDLHSHPLPGLDDGPARFDDSIRLLEAAWHGGTRTMVATPHMFQEGLGSDDHEEVAERFERFEARLGDHRRAADDGYLADLELVLGAENYFGEAFVQALGDERVLTLGGSSYLLLEFWPATTRAVARRAVATVQDAGYAPVLAHVERYAFLQQDPSFLAEVVSSGCVAQVNAAAVLGLQGLGPARLTDRWLRDGLIAVVASDGHDLSRRTPRLDTVAEHLASRHGAEVAARCLRLNPQAILDDEPVALPEPRRTSWWRRSR